METPSQNEFKGLTKTEQVIQLFRDGKKIEERHPEHYDVHLYRFSGFFVELWYQSNTKKILKVEVVNPERLAKTYPDTEFTDID